jgi:hypothetical protein
MLKKRVLGGLSILFFTKLLLENHKKKTWKIVLKMIGFPRLKQKEYCMVNDDFVCLDRNKKSIR